MKINPDNALINSKWTSKFNFILAATGAAIGLGNIWKFPYMIGVNGGSAFLLIYLICVFLIGLPVMIAEILIGRLGEASAVSSITKILYKTENKLKWPMILGWISAINLLLVLSFYSVVSGWVLFYIFKSVKGELYGIINDDAVYLWKSLLSSPLKMIVCHTFFMALTLFTVAIGVKNGLEKISRLAMPALWLLLIFLVLYSIRVGDISSTLSFLFDFNFKVINSKIIISALGHSCFTLAIGAGAMLVYGSYLKEPIPLWRSVSIIALLDVAVAILTGFAVFPIVFSSGLSPQEGPGLMFISLPVIVSHLAFGNLLNFAFFFLLFFAAWTSSISLAEPLVVLFLERTKFNRKYASFFVGLTAWFLGLFSIFSFNIWRNYHFFNRSIFEVVTDLTTNILLPLGALGFSFFAAWFIPHFIIEKEFIYENKYLKYLWYLLCRFIVPCSMILLLIEGVYGN